MGYSMSSRSGWNKLEDIESAALPWSQPRNLWPFLTLKNGHAVPSSEKVVTSGVPGGLRVLSTWGGVGGLAFGVVVRVTLGVVGGTGEGKVTCTDRAPGEGLLAGERGRADPCAGLARVHLVGTRGTTASPVLPGQEAGPRASPYRA